MSSRRDNQKRCVGVANSGADGGCPFLSRKFPAVSIIRPTSIQQSGAVATLKGFKDDGLFTGQSDGFFDLVGKLAREADAATRKCDAD
jgi:hypothetical protein